jgi:hypothetical protein
LCKPSLHSAAITEFYPYSFLSSRRISLTLRMNSQLIAAAAQNKEVPIQQNLRFGWEEFLKDPWKYILFTAIGIVINVSLFYIPFVGKFVLVVIGLPLQLGIAIYYYHKTKFNDDHFKHFFDGFSYTIELLKFFLYAIIGLLIAMIPLFISVVLLEVAKDTATGTETHFEGSTLSKVLTILYSPIILFLGISILFAPYFIYFQKISAWDSFKTSYQFVKQRWLAYFGFYLIILAISALSAVSVIGLLITTPIVSLAMMHEFFRITQMQQDLQQGKFIE